MFFSLLFAQSCFLKRMVSLVRRFGLVVWESIWLRQGSFPPVTKQTIGRSGLPIGMCAMVKNFVVLFFFGLGNILDKHRSWCSSLNCLARLCGCPLRSQIRANFSITPRLAKTTTTGDQNGTVPQSCNLTCCQKMCDQHIFFPIVNIHFFCFSRAFLTAA